VNEWLMLKHPYALQWRRVRLGPLPKVEMARAFKVALRWIDAIVYEDGVVYLIEAKIKPKADAVGQLLMYKDLFYQTPEFSNLWDKPVKMVLLTTMDDPNVRKLCTNYNIEYEIFCPAWVKEYLKSLYQRSRK